MSSAYKTSKSELVAIYRLEFYRQKKNWKFCQDVLKSKDSKEKDIKETKASKKKPASEIEKPAKKLLNETYMVDVPASAINEVFFESESGKDTNSAKEPRIQAKEPTNNNQIDHRTPTKEDSRGWANSGRNIALTSILKSEAAKQPDLPLIQDSEERELTDDPGWLETGDEPQEWVEHDRGRQQVKVWSEELDRLESCGEQQVFQPELWSPTREYQLACARGKVGPEGTVVWSKEDQVWPQSPESWPEPILWRDNELIWPAASQQKPAKKVDATGFIWPAAAYQDPSKTELSWADVRKQGQKVEPTKLVRSDDSHQQPAMADFGWPTATRQDSAKPVNATESFWADVIHEGLQVGPTNLGWPDDCQQRTEGAVGSDAPLELAPAFSPAVAACATGEWLPEPLVDTDDCCDDWSRSLCEFMRGAHCRHHSSETDLSAGAAAGRLEHSQPPAGLSQAALRACARRHSNALRALLREAHARDQLSAQLDYSYHPHTSSSYEEYPTRDVGLQGPPGTLNRGPRTPNQADTFLSGSFLNEPGFDLESNSNLSSRGFNMFPWVGENGQGPCRGRGRLVRDDKVIGIRPGGRPYRL